MHFHLCIICIRMAPCSYCGDEKMREILCCVCKLLPVCIELYFFFLSLVGSSLHVQTRTFFVKFFPSRLHRIAGRSRSVTCENLRKFQKQCWCKFGVPSPWTKLPVYMPST